MLLLLHLFFLFSSVYSHECSLYEDFRDSRCFSGNQLDIYLTNSETVWIVEFYSSWCGHCHHFAPTWKRMATRIKSTHTHTHSSTIIPLLGWASVVRMGQIDCTRTDNREICGLYHIEAFPTIKVSMYGLA